MAVIHPEVSTTPDQPTIKIRQAWELTDLDKLIPSILQAQGWPCGTYFNLQFVNHERDLLLADARFVVDSSRESQRTTDNEYSPNTRMVVSYKAKRVTEWRFYNGFEVPRGTSSENDEKQATIRWNPGKKEHELLVGDEVKFSSADKALVEAELEKLKEAA